MNEEIYRVWSLHPKSNKPIDISKQPEEVVASIAEKFPQVIYFFGPLPE